MFGFPSVVIEYFEYWIYIFFMLKRAIPRHSFCCGKNHLPPVNHTFTPYNGPSYETIVKDRKTYMPNLYFHYYKEPLLVTQGHMQYLYDYKGNRYIDLIGGIATILVGHSHPSLTKVVSEQVGKLQHVTQIYFNEWQGYYCKRLCQELGDGFDSVYLCNSGGQANDFAVYISRVFTQQYKFIALKHGYHGLTGSSANLTNTATWNSSFRGGFEFEKFCWPSEYRGIHPNVDSMVKDAQETLDSQTTENKVAGFIFQPIQGIGGINPIAGDYAPRVAELVRQKGGLIIADQVQTGFGRIGTKYWGHKWLGVKPDIVTMAKGIGNGFPMAAVVTRREILDSIKQVYFNTFGGGVLQCRVGIEVLDIIKKQRLDQNAEKVGHYLMTELKKLQKKYRLIGDVRGTGLMIGVELVKDKESKQPGKEETAKLMELTRERGVLFGKGGVHGNVLRIQPPLCITQQDAKYVVDALEDALITIQ